MTAMTDLLYTLPVLLLWLGPAIFVIAVFAWSHTHAPVGDHAPEPHTSPGPA